MEEMETIKTDVEAFFAEMAERHHGALQTVSTGHKTVTAGTETPAVTLDRLKAAGIMKRYQETTFESINKQGIPEVIKKQYQLVDEYSSNLAENINNGVGLVLAGGYGTMKTTLAVAVLRQWLEMNKDNRGVFVPMISLMDNLYTMRSLNREEWAMYEKKIRNTPLLILDDLGGENISQDWVLSKVDSIITERYNKMLPVIITTNFSKKEIEGTYSGRLLDRIKSTAKYISFGGIGSQRQAI